MTLGKCPLCGSRIRAEEMKSSTRLNCGKCHSDLHLGKGGVLVLGAAHDPDDDIRELRQKLRRFASDFPTRKVVTALAVVMVIGLGWNFLFGPAERLDLVAEVAARAIADNDPAALESLAAEGTTDDIRRWYEAVHPRLDQLRTDWGGKTEAVKTVVTQENREEQKGSVGVAIQPESSGCPRRLPCQPGGGHGVRLGAVRAGHRMDPDPIGPLEARRPGDPGQGACLHSNPVMGPPRRKSAFPGSGESRSR